MSDVLVIVVRIRISRTGDQVWQQLHLPEDERNIMDDRRSDQSHSTRWHHHHQKCNIMDYRERERSTTDQTAAESPPEMQQHCANQTGGTAITTELQQHCSNRADETAAATTELVQRQISIAVTDLIGWQLQQQNCNSIAATDLMGLS